MEFAELQTNILFKKNAYIFLPVGKINQSFILLSMICILLASQNKPEEPFFIDNPFSI